MPIVILVLILLLFLESTIIGLPLVLIFLLCLFVLKKDTSILLTGFLSGLFLDVLLLRQFGLTSMVIVMILAIVMLYQRKFEIASYYFVAIASCLAAIVYALIFHNGHIILQATMGSILAILFFSFLRYVFLQKEKPLETV